LTGSGFSGLAPFGSRGSGRSVDGSLTGPGKESAAHAPTTNIAVTNKAAMIWV
jgi:hypothetical protein